MHEARESHLVSTSNIHQIQPSTITGSFFSWPFLFAVAKGNILPFGVDRNSIGKVNRPRKESLHLLEGKVMEMPKNDGRASSGMLMIEC